MRNIRKTVMLDSVQSHLLRTCTGQSPESVYTALFMEEGNHLTNIGPIDLKDGYTAQVFIEIPEEGYDEQGVAVNTVLYNSEGKECDETACFCIKDLGCILLGDGDYEFNLSLNLYEAPENSGPDTEEDDENWDPYAGIEKAGMELSQDDRSELFGSLIDIFEDWLDSKGITPDMIPNEDREGGEDEAIIYGEDYDYLCDQLSDALGIRRYV